jgi:hypothetical protein
MGRYFNPETGLFSYDLLPFAWLFLLCREGTFFIARTPAFSLK